MRKLKRGDILLNRYAGWMDYFLYLGSNGRTAYGVSFIKIDGKYKTKQVTYYTSALKEEDKFPVVGYIDVKSLWENAFLNGITDTRFMENYDETGHKI